MRGSFQDGETERHWLLRSCARIMYYFEDGNTISDVSKKSGVTMSWAAGNVHQMIDSGLLVITAHGEKDDIRSKKLKLTERGREVKKRVMGLAEGLRNAGFE